MDIRSHGCHQLSDINTFRLLLSGLHVHWFHHWISIRNPLAALGSASLAYSMLGATDFLRSVACYGQNVETTWQCDVDKICG